MAEKKIKFLVQESVDAEDEYEEEEEEDVDTDYLSEEPDEAPNNEGVEVCDTEYGTGRRRKSISDIFHRHLAHCRFI